MKVKKLLKVVKESLPINVYKYGEYIGQFTESTLVTRPDITACLNPDDKIVGINAMVLTNGKPCLQVYLKGSEKE